VRQGSVLPMLSRDGHVAKLTAVHGLLATEDVDEAYGLKPYLYGEISI
jgi:hypothetical protein